MIALVAALGVWLLGAVVTPLARRRPTWAAGIGAGSAVVGSIMGAIAATSALGGGPARLATVAWWVPFAAFSLRLDPLAAVFLLPACVVGGLCALLGAASHGRSGAASAFYNLLLASIALVTVAGNLVLLLAAWEAMTLTSYALVVGEHDTRAVRGAGFQYLVFSQLATGALFLLFVLLASGAGTWEIAGLGHAPGTTAFVWLFVLALIGFGTKAAIVPFHIWLPDAHASAPAHVSALMSGVLITTGIYGLARFLPLLGPPAAAAGYALMALGAVGAVGSVLLALVQRDVKRALAYSTVDNAGLIALAMGTGLLGQASGQPALAVLGWGAALLHVWTHAPAKALLFGGFGTIVHALHDRDLERWGGVLRRWPGIGALVIVGALAIAAVPGMSGFVSEWLVIRALFEGALALTGAPRVVLLAAIVSVAMTAGLTVACYVRLVGVGLLGEARHTPPAGAFAPPAALTVVPLAAMAAVCLAIAWFPVAAGGALAAPVRTLVPFGDPSPIAAALRPLGAVAIALAAAVAVAWTLRARLAGREPDRAVGTWDCGYARPDARMQYTGASMAEPIVRYFAPLLRTRIERTGLGGLWPAAATWGARTLDRTVTEVYRPALGGVNALFMRLRGLQEPRVTTYLRYVVLALLAVLTLLFLPIVVRP